MGQVGLSAALKVAEPGGRVSMQDMIHHVGQDWPNGKTELSQPWLCEAFLGPENGHFCLLDAKPGAKLMIGDL